MTAIPLSRPPAFGIAATQTRVETLCEIAADFAVCVSTASLTLTRTLTLSLTLWATQAAALEKHATEKARFHEERMQRRYDYGANTRGHGHRGHHRQRGFSEC